MAKVALVETKPSRTNFAQAFDNKFEFDKYTLCSDPTVKRVLKKDVNIDINIDDYDWIIPVGADAVKYFCKSANVSTHSGKIVDEKFIPIINPAMLTFKPEAEKLWQESKRSVIGYITGEIEPVSFKDGKFYGIQDTQQALEYVQAAIDSPNPYVALDSETTSLYAREGYLLGVSLSYERDHGAYIDVECFTDELENKFQELFNKKIVIFHNAKFDLSFFWYHLKWTFPRYEDTMLLHYCTDENPGGHGLKELALRLTKYGDYEKPLQEYIADYCKKYGMKREDFTYDLIPFDVMFPYAAIDSIVTFLIFLKLKPAVSKNPKLNKLYNEILIPANTFLTEMQDIGVPFDPERLKKAQLMMQTDIDISIDEMYKHEVIKEFEDFQGKSFNPNSTQQLRKLLFDFLGLNPTGKKTGTGAESTDKEVLTELADIHPIPRIILDIRQKSKIKNTYLDKIIPNLNKDNRLRTNVNLHSTTSGRLSSSGKLNMQQLPRIGETILPDGTKLPFNFAAAVKGCIKARPGYSIVSMDLTTAEVYVAAVLSGDKKLQEVFLTGEDFHSSIAKMVFNLDCEVSEVKKLYPLLRQGAKSTTFGILYQAGAPTVASQIYKESGVQCTIQQAQGYIDAYFRQFRQLERWIEENKGFLAANGFTYSHFGRKRRLPNVLSSDRGIKSHTIRSGINFLVQSPASDINLLAALGMHNFIKENEKLSRIFMLVHDSILAEVFDEELEWYKVNLRAFVQKDRGLSIPGQPIGCDFEVGEDYSFGKYEKYEQYWNELHSL